MWTQTISNSRHETANSVLRDVCEQKLPFKILEKLGGKAEEDLSSDSPR